MNKQIIISVVSFFIFLTTLSTSVCAQIGVNTDNPQASLDINGNLRIRQTPEDPASTTVLVVDSITGDVKRAEFKDLLATQGDIGLIASGTSADGALELLDLGLLDDWSVIRFDAGFNDIGAYIDANGEFYAPSDGYYEIYGQFDTELGGIVNLGVDVGIGLFLKRVGETDFSLYTSQSFLAADIDATILGVGLRINTPTVRRVQTVIELKKEDVLTFGAKGGLTSVTLLGGSGNSFFYIKKVR